MYDFMSSEEEHQRRLLFTSLKNKEELHGWIYFFLGVDLPGTIVDESSNCSPLDMAWDCYNQFMGEYDENSPAERLYYASRDGGKTLTMSIIEVLALLHINTNIIHLAAILEQSKNAQRYLKTFFLNRHLRGFMKGDNIRESVIVYYRPYDSEKLCLKEDEWEQLVANEQNEYERVSNWAKIVVATIASTNGMHGGILCVSGDTQLFVPVTKGYGKSRARRKISARGLFRLIEGVSSGGRTGGETEKVLTNIPDGTSLLSLDPVTGERKFVPILRAQRSFQPTVRILTKGTHQLRREEGFERIRSARTGPNGTRELVCTLTHPVMVLDRGFVQAKELKAGDKLVILGKSPVIAKNRFFEVKAPKIVYLDIPEGDPWDQVVLGSLLGDGGVYNKGNSNPWMLEQHCKEQSGYVAWKMQMLSQKVRTTKRNGVSGYTGAPQVGYYAAASPAFRPYLGFRKTLEGIERLGPLGLAVWYMDDGCAGNGFRISSESFSLEQNNKLANLLFDNFKINVSVGNYPRKDKIYYYLHGNIEAKRRLVEICKPYIYPALAYKFDVTTNKGICDFCETEFWYYENPGKTCGTVLCQLLREGTVITEPVLSVEPFGKNWVYDFTLSESHTYISNGIVSHNCLDELDVVGNPAAVEESKNIPTPVRMQDGTIRDALTVITSTRKASYGLVQKAIDEAPKTGLIVKHWNMIDVTQKCPESRHLPYLPKIPIYYSENTLRAVDEETFKSLDPKTQEDFKRKEGFNGCLSKCTLFASCKGRLATSQIDGNEFHKQLSHVTKQVRRNSVEMARSQLFCYQPSSVGLVYPALDRDRHIITPNKCYEMVTGKPNDLRLNKVELVEIVKNFDIRWFGGQDYGYTHLFAAVLGFRFGNIFFVTRCLALPELDPAQMVEACQPLKDFRADWWADPASPGNIALFNRHGFRMRDWNKDKVVDGINLVRAKLSPVGSGEPELYFVHDVGDDPEIDWLFQCLKEYHWRSDAAGRQTDIPDEENDDSADALRYLISNLFPHRTGGVVKVGSNPVVAEQRDIARPSDQMREIIDNLIGPGGDYIPTDPTKPRKIGFIG